MGGLQKIHDCLEEAAEEVSGHKNITEILHFESQKTASSHTQSVFRNSNKLYCLDYIKQDWEGLFIR